MRQRLLAQLGALAACAVGGALFQFLHTPLPWMIGPLLAMAVFRFCGYDLRAPRLARPVGQVTIATALGLYFSPVVAREVISHWQLLVAAAVFATLLAYASAFMLWRLTGVDRTTAFFASVPGGAAEMSNLGERYGARIELIAIAQSLRIVFVVVLVPFAMAAFDVHGSDLYQPRVVGVETHGLVTLLALAAASGYAMKLLRMPNPWFLGPLALAIALTAQDIHFSSIPGVLSNGAQLLIGCSLGTRFDRAFLKSAPRFIAAVSASILAAIAISALFGAGLAKLGGLAIPSMILATAPGGIAEMCITAKVLQLGVPLVTAAQVARVMILVTTTGPLFRLARHTANRMGWR